MSVWKQRKDKKERKGLKERKANEKEEQKRTVKNRKQQQGQNMHVYPIASHTCSPACLPLLLPTCVPIRPPVSVSVSPLCTSQSSDANLQITSAQSDDYSDIPNSQIRRITAKRLLESKQTVPHYYLTIDCRVDKLVHLRQQLNAGLAKDGKKLSVNDFVIKASAQVWLLTPLAGFARAMPCSALRHNRQKLFVNGSVIISLHLFANFITVLLQSYVWHKSLCMSASWVLLVQPCVTSVICICFLRQQSNYYSQLFLFVMRACACCHLCSQVGWCRHCLCGAHARHAESCLAVGFQLSSKTRQDQLWNGTDAAGTAKIELPRSFYNIQQFSWLHKVELYSTFVPRH